MAQTSDTPRHVRRDERGRPISGRLDSRRDVLLWYEARLEALAALELQQAELEPPGAQLPLSEAA